MNSWKVILATIVIFGAGVFTGGLLVNYVQHPRHARATPPPLYNPGDLPAPLRAQILTKQFVEQLNDKLDLTLQQSNQIEKIIENAQQNSRDLWKLVSPQFKSLVQDTRQQIRDVLTPEQRKQYEMLMKQHALRRQPATNAPPSLPPLPTNSPAA